MYKLPSSWANLDSTPPSPCAQNWGTGSCPRDNKMLLHSFGSFAERSILKRRDNGQLILFIISHLFCKTPPHPHSQTHRAFLAAQIIDQPPPLRAGAGLRRHSRRGGNFIGPGPNNLISIAPLTPFSFFPTPARLAQSLGYNGLSRVLYLMTCKSN